MANWKENMKSKNDREHKLVISANPSAAPYSLLLIRKLFIDEGYSVGFTSITHSSVKKVKPEQIKDFCDVNINKPDKEKVEITLIWKNILKLELLVASSIPSIIICDENKIMKYLSCLLPVTSVYNYKARLSIENFIETDKFMDKLQAYLVDGNRIEKQITLSQLDIMLEEGGFLCFSHQMSIVDILAWSLIKQIDDGASAPSNVLKWFKYINSLLSPGTRWPTKVNHDTHREKGIEAKPTKVTSIKNKSKNIHRKSKKELEKSIDIDQQISKFIRLIKFEDCGSREIIRLRIEKCLQKHFNSVDVIMHGSSANNLGLSDCDLDLYAELHSVPVTCAGILADILKAENIGKSFITITSTKVPIVKFKENTFGIQVNLAFKNRLPVYHTELICQYIKTHKLVHPYLMIIRYWAKLQSISGRGESSKFITNYALTLMMLWYLMYRSPPIIPTVSTLQENSEKGQNILIDGYNCYFSKDVYTWCGILHNVSVMELIQEFFSFFDEINFKKYVISPVFGSLMDSQTAKEINFTKSSSLNIQDPFDHLHNVNCGLTENSLLIFQEKCQYSAKVCQDILNKLCPLYALFTKIITKCETNGTDDAPTKLTSHKNKNKNIQRSPIIPMSNKILEPTVHITHRNENKNIQRLPILPVSNKIIEPTKLTSHENKNKNNQASPILPKTNKTIEPTKLTSHKIKNKNIQGSPILTKSNTITQPTKPTSHKNNNDIQGSPLLPNKITEPTILTSHKNNKDIQGSPILPNKIIEPTKLTTHKIKNANI